METAYAASYLKKGIAKKPKQVEESKAITPKATTNCVVEIEEDELHETTRDQFQNVEISSGVEIGVKRLPEKAIELD